MSYEIQKKIEEIADRSTTVDPNDPKFDDWDYVPQNREEADIMCDKHPLLCIHCIYFRYDFAKGDSCRKGVVRKRYGRACDQIKQWRKIAVPKGYEIF
ncbi:MAG: hypothetical protein II502_01600 [Paludibacteraceae bacterium]|nr:hypothetical protein [Paludibacteraceae bacterium]